jgi:hypothetical protein
MSVTVTLLEVGLGAGTLYVIAKVDRGTSAAECHSVVGHVGTAAKRRWQRAVLREYVVLGGLRNIDRLPVLVFESLSF